MSEQRIWETTPSVVVAEVPPPREGAWSEDSDEAWFPRDGMTRDQARQAYLDLAGDNGWVGWTDVSVLRAWCRFDPTATDFIGDSGGLWFPCGPFDSGAVPVWHVLWVDRSKRQTSATAPEALPESQSSMLGDAQSASSGGGPA